MKFDIAHIPVILSVFLITVIMLLFSGCYTLQQGVSMLSYLNQAVPLEDLVQGGNNEDRLFAQRVENIRRYAMEDLGLSGSRNYTRYVELDRDYLAAVVSASASDSFTPHTWWFPIVGRVPYKGFFNIEDAMRERDRLESRGLDVWIRRVDAFSTLGWFRDPLYSFMKNYPERRLAELIIHELFHATLFLTNHVQFNEELATFIGIEGSRLYMEKTYGASWQTDSSTEAENAEADFVSFLTFIHSLIADLDAVYKSLISIDEKLRLKDEVISSAQWRFAATYDDIFLTENYRNFSTMPINNAYLGLFNLYYEEDRYFYDLYNRASQQMGLDLGSFIEIAKSLNDVHALRRGRGDPRAELEMLIF